MKKILQKESPVLREISQTVPLEEISSPKIKTIIKEMKEALHSQEDGVAIAAPQIGYNLRIFVVSKRVEEILGTPKKEELQGEVTTNTAKDKIFINPVIKKLSKEKKVVEEGCLSVRYLYGEVNRSKKATVEAYDENGKKFTSGATGLIAQIFQHEVDHLDGVLFIDKAKNIAEMLPENQDKHAKRNF